MERYLAISMLLLALIVDTRSQFFDFLQPLQPFLQGYTTSQKPIITRPNKNQYNYYNNNNQETRNPTAVGNNRNKNNQRKSNNRSQTSTTKWLTQTESQLNQDTRYTSFIDGSSRDDRNPYNNRKSNNVYTTTTIKPFTSQKNNKRTNKQTDRRKNNQNVNTNQQIDEIWNQGNDNFNNEKKKDKRRPVFDTSIFNNINFFTERPVYQETRAPVFNNNGYNINNQNNRRPQNNYGWTTQNPFYNRPGLVRPAVTDKAPITNKPPTKIATQRPSYNYNRRPDDEAVVFPTPKSEGPELLTGPDQDSMSAAEKRRYIELSERMCDKYKSLQVKQLSAIPLLPSPDPVSVNVSRCLPINIPLIVGGKIVSIQEFPHMALLGWGRLKGGGYSWKCGGSLISDQYVLTAAHCSYQDRDNSVESGPPKVVQLGSSFLDDPGAIVVKVSAAIRHPKYKLPKSYYDLALLKLVNRVSFSERIKPACLGVPPSPGNPVIATGWGRTEFGGDQSQELRSVSIPVWETSECWNVLGTSRKLPDGPSSDSQICAGELEGGKDTCQGDSGGPVQIQDGCAWRVVGVTSLGRSCGAARTPGLYAIAQRPFIAAVAFT